MTSTVTVVPTAMARVASYPPGSTFGPRRTSDCEFVWILRGSAEWYPDGERLRLLPGHLALARPGIVDSYQWDREAETIHAYVHFALADRGPLPPPATWPLVRPLSRLPVLDGLCRYLLDLAGQPGTDASRRSEQLLAVLLELFVAGPFDDPADDLVPPVAAMLETVRSRWRDGLTAIPVSALADGANVSPGHVFRIFRAAYGCSPARALETIRLSRAATLLQRTNATLSEVAHRCGFANAYHFSRRFSAAYGMPPGAYRANAESADPDDPVRRAGLMPVSRALLDA